MRVDRAEGFHIDIEVAPKGDFLILEGNMEIEKRMTEYAKDYCWQYEMRLENLNEDLSLLDGIDYRELKVTDFEFRVLESKAERQAATAFINRHEWLGKIALNTTHWFGAYYGEILSGVVTMGMPNAFSNICDKDKERLISRGACISWSPKCLASHFIMWCIKWVVANTEYRVFTAYSDPMAKEMGTIYQSCNFYYLGNKFGANVKYISPYSGKVISDRTFRSRSYYKRYAQELGIEWDEGWNTGDRVNWEKIPEEVSMKLRGQGRLRQAESRRIEIPKKHKYAYILGIDKRETKRLRKEFLAKNKVYEYPKERGK